MTLAALSSIVRVRCVPCRMLSWTAAPAAAEVPTVASEPSVRTAVPPLASGPAIGMRVDREAAPPAMLASHSGSGPSASAAFMVFSRSIWARTCAKPASL